MELTVGFICTSPYLVCSVLTLFAQVFVLLFLPPSPSLSLYLDLSISFSLSLWTKRKAGLIHFLDFQVVRTFQLGSF